MTNVPLRAWRCLAALSLLAAASAFAQPSLNVSDRAMLRQILQAMPKGGDLHNHLSGSTYAESYLQYAANDGICVDTVKLLITPCATPQQIAANPASTASIVPASAVFAPYTSLYGDMLDSLSMRQFRPGLESGHDHFFDTFGKFSAVSKTHVPEMLTQDVWRLASENVDYVETIFAPDFGRARELLKFVKPDQSFAEMRTAMMQSGHVPPIITASRAVIDQAEGWMRNNLHCGTASAQPGCDSTVRYIYELHRGVPLQQLFAEMVVGYELASADPRVVGLNPVMPEDSYISMHDFDEQMRMFAFFHQLYPKIHLSTHAGELWPGFVEPEGLRFHIRDSVMIANADRIGHGVDLTYEDDAAGLLKTMASRGVAVEVCLTSNDVILGVSGKAHPLRYYLAAGVPVALATDDPGVSRDDMTNQYMRAVQEQGLDYATLKRLARNSLEYSFAEGESLWDGRDYSKMNSACSDAASSTCKSFLAANTKARIESRLEQRLRDFESAWK
ncbi:MAG TPA: adenosine deaminase [Thermoanaerobaculia bacterium]|jgi:adenosine deaminase|nr:adenosine deaminase [Thermoanaerobaculia bacterium]